MIGSIKDLAQGDTITYTTVYGTRTYANNYVKLRDIGQMVDFGVAYDAGTNIVTISPNKPYKSKVITPATTAPVSQAAPSALSTNADGPVGPLPEATCDWSQFDQPELPRAEVRRFNDPDGDYIFIRNLYETRRMLYSLYTAELDWLNAEQEMRQRQDKGMQLCMGSLVRDPLP